MKFFTAAKAKFPSLPNSLLALLSAILLVLAFPGFEFWFLAWFAPVPLFWAVEREKHSIVKSFLLGWLWGIVFFFGTCWWLAYAPTHYGGMPAPVSYFLVLCACSAVGIFPAIFALLFSILLRRLGVYAIFSAPFLWTAIEFLRFWTTGNNWNAIAYSQAFRLSTIQIASIGGVYLVGFLVISTSSYVAWKLLFLLSGKTPKYFYLTSLLYISLLAASFELVGFQKSSEALPPKETQTYVIAVQPNVPMSGLKYEDWQRLREKHVELTENALRNIQRTGGEQPVVVIFPESPMNFRYDRDREFQEFLSVLTKRHNVSLLFNSAEPDAVRESYFNSAVMVNEKGEKIAQYDKIFLLPFGEYAPVPAPLQSLVPTMVGNFSFGTEYDLLPFGAARGGVMICFESHFPNLSREYARAGADVLIEMTNDGYLGNTPVLRQHLASAVFRAVETRRPVVRVTNVGVTAYIDERGEILDAAEPYTQATRVWTIAKSDGNKTFYVKYGDWFAWLCALVGIILILSGWRRKFAKDENKA
ncbi:MAG TPA: apolipoprotein N-acyltransferase [Pyrinomonadaceae bacterium]|jgi:apolipoprotein N-acyltransferase